MTVLILEAALEDLIEATEYFNRVARDIGVDALDNWG